MGAVLPLGCLVLLVLVLHQRIGRWRSAALSAACVWGVWVVLVSEGLSLFAALSYWWLITAWGTMSAALLGWYVIGLILAAGSGRPSLWFSLAKVEKSLLGAALAIIALVGVVALVAPPNTWDSMTYHMSRVVHWMAQRSLDHYPTYIDRQNYQQPWAEMVILHFQVLSGSDRLANIIQWLAFVGCAAGVSLIAQELGAGARGQVLSAVVAATIPSGVLQASGTQNNYVLAFWLVSLGFYLLAWRRQWDGVMWGAGASMGLALLTKGTAYVLGAPLVVGLAAVVLARWRWKALAGLMAVALIAATLNLGHYWRNWCSYGSPLMLPSVMRYYRCDATGPRLLVSNLLRNLALHFATPERQVNEKIVAGVEWLHKVIAIDANDPRITLSGMRFGFSRDRMHEDISGSPLNVVLAGITLVFLWQGRRRAGGRGCDQGWLVPLYASILMTALVLFSLMLKWQPFHVRLHLPLLVLWAPLTGLMLEQWRRPWAHAVVIVLIGVAVWAVLVNQDRPLLGKGSVLRVDRVDQYFANHPKLRDSYQQAAAFMANRGCERVGLVCGGDQWEYPLWVLMQHSTSAAVDIKHVYVNGGEPGTGDRQAIVVLDEEQLPRIRAKEERLTETHTFGSVEVLVERGSTSH